MESDQLSQLHEAQLRQVEGYGIVLLSSRLRDRHRLLAALVTSGHQTWFHTLAPQSITLHEFLGSLADGLREYDPACGRQTYQALAHEHASPEELADALLSDLTNCGSSPHYVVLDQFDYLITDQAVRRFWDAVTKHVGSDVTFVINSRQLDRGFWKPYVASQKAVVLGDTLTLAGGMFQREMLHQPLLEVFALSSGEVFVDGRPITIWDGPLPRLLFYFLVDHPLVTRDEIFDTFWPNLPTKEATNVFHVTKRKISERLGYELTRYAGGFYHPSEQLVVHYDVAAFEAGITDNAEPTSDQLDDLLAAIRLYRGPFLYGLSTPWINRRREQLKGRYIEALIAAGRIYQAQGDQDRAIGLYLCAQREMPEREDVCRILMNMYRERGEVARALTHYQQLTDRLKQTLHITPSKSTQMLYQEILA
jgi:DNA-binding SARP family transcriptional activator